MKKAFISSLVLSAIIVVLNAQETAPVPYVASVKKSAGGLGAQMRIAPGMISANGVPVRLLMRQAFGQLQDFQLIGGPDWISSDRFDIEAKIEGGAPMTPLVLQSVIRQILEERFALKTHRETRELPIYALMVARSDGRLGPNLKPSSTECSTMMSQRGRGPAPGGAPGPDARGGVAITRSGPPPDGRGGPGRAGGPPPFDFDAPPVCGQRGGGFGRLRAGGTTMADFATMISGTAQRVVIDKTRLTGYYDIALTYTPTGDQLPQGAPPPGAPAPPPIDPDGPSFFTAIQEQLGLKLDNQRGPVDVVVIDSIQQPTEN
ncbi:MAG TPA: TIGR03435 family protein [Vicinamibacterales bacterium]